MRTDSQNRKRIITQVLQYCGVACTMVCIKTWKTCVCNHTCACEESIDLSLSLVVGSLLCVHACIEIDMRLRG